MMLYDAVCECSRYYTEGASIVSFLFVLFALIPDCATVKKLAKENVTRPVAVDHLTSFRQNNEARQHVFATAS